MNIIAHRGYWLKESEKNTVKAFLRACDHEFGIETDIRDVLGQLVISHDMPLAERYLNFHEIFNEYFTNYQFKLALNIKSDGLFEILRSSYENKLGKQTFFFDMSVPDLIGFKRNNLPIYSRISDIENHIVELDSVKGVWVDAFYSDWKNLDLFIPLLDRGYELSFVSPELHGREYKTIWKIWKDIFNSLTEQEYNLLSICTDYPKEAREYFK